MASQLTPLVLLSALLIGWSGREPALGWLAVPGLMALFQALRHAPTAGRAALATGVSGMLYVMPASEGLLLHSPPAFAALNLLQLALHALPGALVWWALRRHPRGAWALLPPLWVAVEALPGLPLFGAYANPTGVIGYGQSATPLGAWAAVGGVHLVSLCLLTVSVAALHLITARPQLRVKLALAALLPFAGALLPLQTQQQREQRVATVQPAISDRTFLRARYTQGEWERLLERLLALTQAAKPDRRTLVIWPEGVLPREDRAGSSYAREVVSRFRAAGLPDVLYGGFSGEGTESYNTLLHYDANAGQVTPVYRKRRLVPGIESWATPGEQQLVLNGVGYVICVESIYPGEFAELVRRGATLLVVPSSTRWAGWTATGRMHLITSRMRAIETGRSVVHASQFGPSALIGPRGEIVRQLALGETGHLTGTLPTMTGSTLYSRYQRAVDLSLASLGWIHAALILGFRRRQRSGPAAKGLAMAP